MESKKITRRKLLKDTVMAAVAGTVYMSLPMDLLAGEAGKTPVVLIRDKDVLNDQEKLNAEVLSNMLDQAVLKLMEEKNIQQAWKKLVKPEDIVGIKTNEWAKLRTPSELENALKMRVMEAGVKEQNISIRDRGLLDDPIFMNATALINTRPMRTHAWAGVGSLIKNYIMFTKTPWDLHPDSCADLATIWSWPMVKGKTRLNVLVMLTPLFHGVGPHHFNKEYTWPYKGLIVGFDPVAVDSTGLRIIQARRIQYFGEDRPVNPPAKHIALADTRHGLGTADPAKINLIKIGWEEGILI
jgi:hypothetical protein